MPVRNPKHALAKLLKCTRDSSGLNQTEFADAVGITASHVSKLESGAAIPSLAVLVSISEKFDLDRAAGVDLLNAAKKQSQAEKWARAVGNLEPAR